MSVMYLMDMKKYEEAETYTASVLSLLNCRPQEKFLILAVVYNPYQYSFILRAF